MSTHHEPRGTLAARSTKLITSNLCPRGVQRGGEKKANKQTISVPDDNTLFLKDLQEV